MIKKCKYCHRELPADVEHFYRHKECSMGLSAKCKECKGGKFGIKFPNRVLGSKEGYKICTKCLKELPLSSEYFHKHTTSHDEFGSKCKECHGSSYGIHHPNKIIKSKVDYKICSVCRHELPYCDFSIMRDIKDGYNSRCRKCDYKVHLKGYKKPHILKNKKEYAKNYRKHYYKTEKGIKVNVLNCQKRRSRKLNSEIDYSIEIWSETLNHYKGKCAYCGKGGSLHQEHIIPLSKGGGYIKSNIIPACYHCNGSKHDHDLNEWYPKQTFYSMSKMAKINEWKASKTN